MTTNAVMQFDEGGKLIFSTLTPIHEVAPSVDDNSETLDKHIGKTYAILSVLFTNTSYGQMAKLECVDEHGVMVSLRTTSIGVIGQLSKVDKAEAFPVVATIEAGRNDKGEYYYLA